MIWEEAGRIHDHKSAGEESELVLERVEGGDRPSATLHPRPKHLLVVIIVVAMESRLRTA